MVLISSWREGIKNGRSIIVLHPHRNRIQKRFYIAGRFNLIGRPTSSHFTDGARGRGDQGWGSVWLKHDDIRMSLVWWVIVGDLGILGQRLGEQSLWWSFLVQRNLFGKYLTVNSPLKICTIIHWKWKLHIWYLKTNQYKSRMSNVTKNMLHTHMFDNSERGLWERCLCWTGLEPAK